MCCGKDHGAGMDILGRVAARKAQRQHDAQVAADAVRAYVNGGQPAKSAFDRATDKARNVLKVVLMVFVMFLLGAGAVGAAVHALVILAAVVAGAALLGFAGLVWRVRSVNRREALAWAAPAPDLADLTPEVQALVARGVVPLPVRRPAAIRGRQGAGKVGGHGPR